MSDDSHPADTGCSESPTCVTCPLPACRYDDPVAYQRLLRQRRDKRMLPIINLGMTREQAAGICQVSPRTIYRIKRRNP